MADEDGQNGAVKEDATMLEIGEQRLRVVSYICISDARWCFTSLSLAIPRTLTRCPSLFDSASPWTNVYDTLWYWLSDGPDLAPRRIGNGGLISG